jgi:1,4-alpha-glucan branching enzyme
VTDTDGRAGEANRPAGEANWPAGDTTWRAGDAEIAALVGARHADPFGLLGPHVTPEGLVIRAFVPGATSVQALIDGKGVPLRLRHADGFFEGLLPDLAAPVPYVLLASNAGGDWELDDPYRFAAVLGDIDDYLLHEGTHQELYARLGAHPRLHEWVEGVHFAVWAPNAQRVSVVGDFNAWDGRRHQMRKRLASGVWEIFAPRIAAGIPYKYEIVGSEGHLLPLKADPVGMRAELRPSTASVVASDAAFPWDDALHLKARGTIDQRRAPMSIYEVHLGSWRRNALGGFLTYDELADTLIPYVIWMGFTHIQLLPVSEHPLDASWGYQPIGLFAPTARFGDPEGFARFVDRAHRAGLSVLLDWVPAHFPTDIHGLSRFDGTGLYEHEDPRRGFHPDWNTAIYNFGRREVANMLAASALYWLDRFHIDGLRVDAVASMLYLDYSRREGEWLPNVQGGRENLEAIAFLRKVNTLAYGLHPGIAMIAEESTSWPGVSAPVDAGGLGFGFKWNMGWMNDTLAYLALDPVHRRWHHERLTFGLLYAFSENFVLPISHDEVVHGKRTLLGRVPGDAWQKFATVRAYYGFMWGHPGKKLLFMGQEFAQGPEWDFNRSLEWNQSDEPLHNGVRLCVRDLNRLHRDVPALYQRDCEAEGFRWITADDREQSVTSWLRFGDDGRPVAVISNFTPVPRHAYRIGLPMAGFWREILNTDSEVYGGSGLGNLGGVVALPVASHGLQASADILVPPLATVFLRYEPG